MKRKNMKQVLAAMMSAAMVMSMPMAAMAAEEGEGDAENVPATETKAEVEAPIYSFDVTQVVVPTNLVVAFNPDELSVDTGGDSPATAQVLSQNFGILNKSYKDKIVTVTLKVEDLNGDKITFVDTAAKATDANEGEYAVYLTAVVADDTQVKVGTADAGTATDATAMANVTMTKATGDGVVTLAEGDNAIAFVLKKATYAPITGSEIELGTTIGNSVKNNLELTAVEKEDGITAFTFDGKLNKKTDWTQLTKGIKITAVYDFQTTYDYDTLTKADGGSVVSGTGAMLTGVAPSIATTDFAILESGKDANIKVNLGVGDLKATKVTGVLWDGTNSLGKNYSYADGVVTIPAGDVDWFLANPTKSREFEITFDDAANTSLTVNLTEKPATN